jgi:hypothetical protein
LVNKIGSGILCILIALTVLLTAACGQATPTSSPAALTISTTSLPAGQVGIIYSQTLKASGGSGKYTWSIKDGSLPGNLALTNTGSINGMPSAGGAFNFTASVNDGANTVTQTYTLTIKTSGTPLLINTIAAGKGVLGGKYSQTLAASGGSGAYTWSVSGGSLPEGLTLDSNTGIISGKPAKTGNYQFTIQVNDGAGSTTQGLAIAVTELTLNTTPLVKGEVKAYYYDILVASGGSSKQIWIVSSGALPEGLTMDPASGYISGYPVSVGTTKFTAKVVDSTGPEKSMEFSITVVSAVKIDTLSLATGQAGTPYSQVLKASEGSGPYTWSITEGMLPNGLTLDEKSGTISGTPLGDGKFNITVKVGDGLEASTTARLVLTINAAKQ